MTNDSLPPPPDDAGPPAAPPERPRSRRLRGLRAAAWILGAMLLAVVLAALALYGALVTEQGTRLAWRAAVAFSGGRLSGTLVGGTFARGVELADVRWQSGPEASRQAVGTPPAASQRAVETASEAGSAVPGASVPASASMPLPGGAASDGAAATAAKVPKAPSGGTDIRIDRLAGHWILTRAPWRFTIADLHAGTIEAHLAASESHAPPSLPSRLELPLELDIQSASVERLRLVNASATTELDGLRLSGHSDGRHHQLSLKGVDTQYGALNGRLSLDGLKPFALAGDIHYAGTLAAESVALAAHLSGTLETLIADIEASGFKLTGHAHVEAQPFNVVPLRRAQLSFTHVNPQTFSPAAPLADLALEANLAPVSATRGGPLVVAGPVSIVNAKPGTLQGHRLPLVGAYADVRLDAREQRIENLRVNLVHDAMLTGGGDIAGGRGRLRVEATRLDLSALTPYVRPTAFDGPIAISLEGGAQSVELDLTDKHAGLGARARVSLEPAQIGLHGVRVSAGPGRIELDGTLARDERKAYDLRAALTDFDPRLLVATPEQQARALAEARSEFAGNSLASDSARGESPGGERQAMPGKPREATRTGAGRTRAGAAVATGAARASTSKTIQATKPKKAADKTTTEKTFALPAARVNGTLTAAGAFAPEFATKVRFKLGNSVYEGFPLTGAGTVELEGRRLKPSDATLSIAGNELAVHGSFGGRGDRLRFRIAAPNLDRLGFGLAGAVNADGDLTGSIAHPDATLSYDASNVSFGANRIGSATGRAVVRDGANGALEFAMDARDLHTSAAEFASFSAHLSGTRAKHVFDAAGKGTVRGRPVDLAIAAAGGLSETRDGPRWDGWVTRLANRGMPALELQAPLKVSVGREAVALGSTRVALEGAQFELKSFVYDHGALATAGSLGNVSLARLLAIHEELTGRPSPLRSDLVFAGDWDFSLGRTARGYARIDRTSGDLSVDTGRGGLVPLGISAASARMDMEGGRVAAKLHMAASRVGSADANAAVPLTPDAARGGVLGVSPDAPLAGGVRVDLPSLKSTGGLLGPTYLLDGSLALKLALAGTVAKPSVSGSLTGDRLAATYVDQGVQLKDGVVRIALTENLVDFQDVEFHGGDGTLRASGRIRLDRAEPDLTAQIVADKLELFAAPDRHLSLSGRADVSNAGPAGGMSIDGKFKVDRALFDMPELPAPKLSDDVVIVRDGGNGGVVGAAPPPVESTMTKPAGSFTPRADIDIDLGPNFRFRGRGADLGLRGTVTLLSAPFRPLRAIGNVRVTEGSTYTTFGRKLAIENGFFTFNGPVANPGINILAMRRNQDVVAGVQVTGTLSAPVVKLVSEPNVSDDEKLSWLLFGHGTDQGNNLGQQSTMTTALALLGSATGKRVANTIGLDEFTVGHSEVGLTDPQVVMLSKAITERLVLGYEQGLQSANNAFKATVNLSRFWSVSAYGGTFQGIDIGYTRRFDTWWGRP